MGKILIIGSEGAQGKRYQAILKYLHKETYCADLGSDLNQIFGFGDVDGVIIATPTSDHLDRFHEILDMEEYRGPILCEKPITTDVLRLKELVMKRPKLTMVMQYRHFLDEEDYGDSFYNYFRHGNDGLYWDCLQIIGLAKGHVTVHETSPIWTCAINGVKLNVQQMDRAYVQEIRSWLRGEKQDLGQVLAMHEKVQGMLQ